MVCLALYSRPVRKASPKPVCYKNVVVAICEFRTSAFFTTLRNPKKINLCTEPEVKSDIAGLLTGKELEQLVRKGPHTLVKLLLIGDSGVGKSSLIIRFSDDTFSPSYITTIGIDFKVKTVEVEGKRIKLQIWDTAGQERFRTITTAYYRGAMGILLVYDVTKEKSFDNIKNWVRNIEQHASKDVEKVLIGNKLDCVEERVISEEKGKALAAEYDLKYFETSAKVSTNVNEAFHAVVLDIKHRLLDKGFPNQNGGAGGRVPKTNGFPVQEDPLPETTHRGGCC
eukprot:Clim_evm82s128 gene=Clim_evmTU82s128